MIEFIKTTWEDFTTWLGEVFQSLFDFIKDVFLIVFELLLDGVVFVFNAITPPDFLATGMAGLFNVLHPDILYFLSMSGIDQGLAIFGAGVSFRLIRKLFTLGQW